MRAVRDTARLLFDLGHEVREIDPHYPDPTAAFLPQFYAGIRTESESVPIYGEVPGITAQPIEFGFGKKLAPRLGFAYDVTGDGRNKVYGSWGIFYDIFKLELPRGSYGGDKWTEYYYTLDTPDWTSVNNAQACPRRAPAHCSASPTSACRPTR